MKYTIPLVLLGLGILLLIFVPNTRGTVNAEDANANVVSVTRADIEGSDDETPVVLMSAKNVTTDTDLYAYALTALKADSKIDAMVFDNSQVSVSYPAHGRALGLVPVDIMVEATVDTQGNVSIKYPWYKFGVVKDTGNLETNLKSEIADATANLTQGTEESSTQSPAFMAEMASRVYSVMKRNLESGSVNAESHSVDVATQL